MTETERDPTIEESAEQILDELREINKKQRNIAHELHVIDDNYHSFRDRSLHALLSTVCEDMEHLVQEQAEWWWEIDKLFAEVNDDD